MGVKSRVGGGRLAAASALLAVEAGEHLEDALARLAPSGEDRAQAWFLSFGVLRQQATLDAALRVHLRKPITGLDPCVRVALRLGTYEKLFANTPDHAAVDQAVELVRALGGGRAQGIVNAVLRKVAPPEGLSRADRLNHPTWLLARWTARYGVAETEAWCAANNEPPPLFAVCPSGPPEGLLATPAALGGRPLPGVWQLHGVAGAIPELPGFREGRFWIQDAASVAVADLVGEVEGRRVLDACAAPGGKSLRLASRGARVTAADLSADRLALLGPSAARLGLSVDVRVHDWEKGTLRGEPWDAVLVDAPCSALGTVRRHPEIRWRRQPQDPRELGARQRWILENACGAVAPGGTLVYAVCSPEPEEGEQVVASFLADHPEYHLDEVLHTAPPQNGEDAFHAARLLRG